MRRSLRAGALVIGVAAGVALAVPLALPAAAAVKPHVACAKLTSPPIASGNSKATLASCTPAALKAGGSATTKITSTQRKGTVTQTIAWKGGKGTTVLIIKYAPTTIGKCKAPYTGRVKITGTVKSATGAAAKIVKKGEPVTAFVCAVTKSGPKLGQSTLEPGTKFKL